MSKEELITKHACREYRHEANEPQFDCDMVEFQKDDLLLLMDEYAQSLAKEVIEETVEKAAERLTVDHYNPSYLPAKPKEYNFYKGFIAGANWKNHQPVTPTSKEVKSAEEILFDHVAVDNSNCTEKGIIKNPYNPITEPASYKWFNEKPAPSKNGVASKNVKSAEEILPPSELALEYAEKHGLDSKGMIAYAKGYQKGHRQAHEQFAAQHQQSEGMVEVPKQWIKVSEVMPPFDTMVLLRGIISWKSKNSVSYFSDVVNNDYEILEYGQSGYLLQNNSDYLVVNHPNPEEVCSEYITHWMPINEPVV